MPRVLRVTWSCAHPYFLTLVKMVGTVAAGRTLTCPGSLVFSSTGRSRSAYKCACQVWAALMNGRLGLSGDSHCCQALGQTWVCTLWGSALSSEAAAGLPLTVHRQLARHCCETLACLLTQALLAAHRTRHLPEGSLSACNRSPTLPAHEAHFQRRSSSTAAAVPALLASTAAKSLRSPASDACQSHAAELGSVPITLARRELPCKHS